MAQLLATLGGIVVLASCASPETAQPAPPQTASPPTASLLTQRVSFGQVEMQLPDSWGVHANGNSAVVGVLAGGDCDVPIRVEIHYQNDADSLVPACCPQHAPFVPATSVRMVESGLQPVGDRTAQFRRFSATCADLTIERRAWLLPDAQVAIVEQDVTPENELVVRHMQVGTLEDVVFGNVTFHIPPSWGIDVDHATAVIGKLPTGARDSRLVVTKNFTQSADDLVHEKDCPAGEVDVIDSGVRRLDGATADYRQFVVHCPAEPAEAQRAWVLPDSNIAIVEDQTSPDVDEIDHVVMNATVRP
jgi:hypothetical protein